MMGKHFAELDSALAAFFRATDRMNEEGGDPPEPLDPESFWLKLFLLAQNFTDNGYAMLYHWAQHYRFLVPSVCALPISGPKFVVSRLENLRKNWKTMEFEKVKGSLAPLVRLLPFLEGVNALEVIRLSINFIDDFFKVKKRLNTEFLKIYDDVVVEDFTLETFNLIVDYFQEESGNPAGIAVFGCIVSEMMAIRKSLLPLCDSIISKSVVSEDRKTKWAGFWFLSKFLDCDEIEEWRKANDVFEWIRPIIFNEDMDMIIAGHKLMKRMVRSRVLDTRDTFEVFSVELGNYSLENVHMFFSVFHAFIYPDRGIKRAAETDQLVMIRDFLVDQLRNESQDALIHGHCISILSDILRIDTSLLFDQMDLIWKSCENILAQKRMAVFPLICPFLVGLCRVDDVWQTSVEKYALDMIDGLALDKYGPLSCRLDMAIDLAEIVSLGSSDEIPRTLASFAFQHVKCLDDGMRACAIIQESVSMLSQQSAIRAIERVLECFSLIVPNEPKWVYNVDFALKTLKMILDIDPEKLKIPKGSALDSFIMDFVNKKVRNLPNISIANYCEGVKLLDRYMKLRPECIPFVLGRFDEFIPSVHPNSMARYVAPYASALSSKNLEPRLLYAIWGIVSEYLDRATQAGHALSARSCIQCLISAWNYTKKHGSFHRVDFPVQSCLKWAGTLEQERPHIDARPNRDLAQMIPPLTNFLMMVALENPSMVEENVFIGLFGYMPFPPDAKFQRDILELMPVFLTKYNGEECTLEVLRVVADLLLLPDQDYQEFKFKDGLTKAMKSLLLTRLTDNEPLRGEVEERLYYQNGDSLKSLLSELKF